MTTTFVDNLAESMRMKDKLELGKKRAEELGLRHHGLHLNTTDVYFADDIHRLLGEGTEYSFDLRILGGLQVNAINPQFEGIMIGIKPITPPSEERQIIQAFVNAWDQGTGNEQSYAISRAKGWLERNKK